jgi:hypothetical protein
MPAIGASTTGGSTTYGPRARVTHRGFHAAGAKLSYPWAMLVPLPLRAEVGRMARRSTTRRGAAASVVRGAVLAYRLRAHDLAAPATGPPGVLDVGVQDTPPGATAPIALRVRSTATIEPYDDPALALVHGVRGAMHLHRAADLPALAAALLPDDAADLLASAHGQFFAERAAEGMPVRAVFETVTAAMARATADGRERTKGELSTAVTPLVPGPVAPWCGGCGVHHVHDGLFRMASLQAGLRLRPAGDGSARFVAPGPAAEFAAAARRHDATRARSELVRRFLRRCGPATADVLAAWLGLAPPAARRWWALVADDLVAVDVGGRALWVHADDLAEFDTPDTAPPVLLLPPYDPITEVADRALLVPDAARRRLVWRAAANPGVLLLDGEVAGVWRRRRGRTRPSVTVATFEPLAERRRAGVTAAVAEILGIEPDMAFEP